MKWFTASRIALRALAINKLRSVLTMLGLIVGVAAVITTVAVAAGARSEVEEQVASLGTNLLIVVPGSQRVAGVRLGAGSRPSLSESDASALQRELPGVHAAAPNLRGSGPMVYGPNNWLTSFHGSTRDFFEARNWRIASGRSFTEAELERAAKVILLGETVAHNLFGDMDPIGQIIRVKKVPFTVIGVLDRKGQNSWGQDQDDVVLMPLSTAKKKVLGVSQANARSVGAISVKILPGEDLATATTQIGELLRQRHKLQPYQEDDFTVRNLAEILQTQEESSKVMTYLLAAIASVSLFVGGIGIMNIMLVSVTERTREIGLRMAVGARARDILTQFLVEAVTLSLIGGVIGIALGIGGSNAIAYFADWRTVLAINAVVVAFGFAAAIGIFFGFYPARKASRLDPIEALRYE